MTQLSEEQIKTYEGALDYWESEWAKPEVQEYMKDVLAAQLRAITAGSAALLLALKLENYEPTLEFHHAVNQLLDTVELFDMHCVDVFAASGKYRALVEARKKGQEVPGGHHIYCLCSGVNKEN